MEWKSVADLKRLLRCRYSTARQMVEDGKIPAMRVGNRWKIPASVFADIEAGKYPSVHVTPSSFIHHQREPPLVPTG